MENSKKIISMILVLSMVLSIVACGEENESSSEINDSTISSEESSSEAESSIVTSEVESEEPGESEVEQNDLASYGTLDFQFEAPDVFDAGGGANGITYDTNKRFLKDNDWRKHLKIVNCFGIHQYGGIDYSLTDCKDWLSQSKEGMIENFEYGSSLIRLSDDDSDMVIKNQETLEINGRTFIKFNGYFNVFDADIGKESPIKYPYCGYMTVYQSDNSYEYKEPEICSIIATMPEDKADMEKMQEVADHAAETLEFLK